MARTIGGVADIVLQRDCQDVEQLAVRDLSVFASLMSSWAKMREGIGGGWQGWRWIVGNSLRIFSRVNSAAPHDASAVDALLFSERAT